MFKVAMVDHHLNNWHADTFLKMLRGPLADEGLEIVSAWESDPVGDDWCAKSGVRRAESIEHAVTGADGVMLLAPDNIDVHLTLAKAVLSFGKPTLIDKFLAPTLTDARQIADIAARYYAPIFSASALRYAVELESALPSLVSNAPSAGRFTGMGTWKIYGVHTTTMALRVFGPEVRRVIDSGTPTAHTVTLDYGSDRRVIVDVREASNGYAALGWTFAVKTGTEYVTGSVVDHEGFYLNLMRRTASFFKTGQADMSVDEALATVAVLEAAERSQASGGEWIELE